MGHPGQCLRQVPRVSVNPLAQIRSNRPWAANSSSATRFEARLRQAPESGRDRGCVEPPVDPGYLRRAVLDKERTEDAATAFPIEKVLACDISRQQDALGFPGA